MGVTVLVVDDYEAFRTWARAVLEAEGYQVIGEASDGASAISAARELEPQVVLLDVRLPDLSGFEVARLLRDGDGPAVILTSTRDRSDYGGQIASSGALGFIPKSELSGAAISALVGGPE